MCTRVKAHRRRLEDHPGEDPRQILGRADADAFTTAEVQDQFNAGGAVGKVVQDPRIGRGGIGVDGAGADVPVPVVPRLGLGPACQRRRNPGTRTRRGGVVAVVERLDAQSVEGRADQRAVEVLALEHLVHRGQPLLAGGTVIRRKIQVLSHIPRIVLPLAHADLSSRPPCPWSKPCERISTDWCNSGTMSASDDHQDLLNLASTKAKAYLHGVAERSVPPAATTDDLLANFAEPLTESGRDPHEVIEHLVANAEPGLTAMGSPRFFGFVIGGTYPVAVAADWLTSAWDQNVGLREVTPAHSAAREAVEGWLVDILGLPAGTTMGTVTGGLMANFTGLTAGRHAVLARAGWDVEERGLQGAPRVRVLVGAERHDTVDLALRYLGLGAPEAVPADEQGRIHVDALASALATYDGPTIVALQAGNVHSGAFDDFAAAIPIAHEHGAWVHIDGAFGLWAAASPTTRHLVAGLELADSWATDAHKTLNVPYDSGLAFVADSVAHRAAMGIHAPYLIHSQGPPDPLELGPEFSQRGRAFALWATLQYLGRGGIADLVDRMVGHAQAFADGVRAIGGEVLNDVVFTQVCTAWGDDTTTTEVERLLLADGAAWMTGSTWQGRKVLRIAVSNQATTEQDVQRALEALGRAYQHASRR